mmetsp:Transcript_6462/g.14266  ORF Transcript_6462/g.14266 Transcript_6462/m.14266 type:complete len:336 (-) Transcript_6462:13-1020(-)
MKLSSFIMAGIFAQGKSANTLRGLGSDTLISCGGEEMTAAEWNAYWPSNMTTNDWIYTALYIKQNGDCDKWNHFTAYFYQDGAEMTVELSQDLCKTVVPCDLWICALSTGGTQDVEGANSDWESKVTLTDAYINSPNLSYTMTSQSNGVMILPNVNATTENFSNETASMGVDFSNSIQSTSSNTVSETTGMSYGMSVTVGGSDSPVSSTVSESFSYTYGDSKTTSQTQQVAQGTSQSVPVGPYSCVMVTQVATEGRVSYNWTGPIASNGFYLFNKDQGSNGKYKLIDGRARNGNLLGALDSYAQGSVLVSYEIHQYETTFDSNGDMTGCDWNVPV